VVEDDVSGPRSGYARAGEPVDLLSAPRARPRPERADAARNRAKVLDAAARLFADHGVGAVSMDAIAAAAGVGKGTLFRRFGDKAGLAVALLDERERDLQERIMRGPAPLGPGAGEPAPAADARLRAFVDAYLDHLLDHLDLVRMSEASAPGARYRIGSYRFWHRHVAILLAAARPDLDAGAADAAAHTLLAALAAEHVAAVLPDLGPDRLRDALHEVLTGLTAPRAATPS
jgi:AcrR family transcriptional regulator